MIIEPAVLVILGTMIHNEDDVIIEHIDLQLYVKETELDKTCEELLWKYDSYLIPSQYKGLILFKAPIKREDILPNFIDGNWEIIEHHIPNYDSRRDILEIDILQRLVDNEVVSDSDLKWALKGKPETVSNDQWFYSKLAESTTILFIELNQLIKELID